MFSVATFAGDKLFGMCGVEKWRLEGNMTAGKMWGILSPTICGTLFSVLSLAAVHLFATCLFIAPVNVTLTGNQTMAPRELLVSDHSHPLVGGSFTSLAPCHFP
jgi:hypothetical protein